MLADVGPANHLLRNNLALGPGTALARATQNEIDDDVNSWSLPVRVSVDDFLSVVEELATAPRQADGSLPRVDFLRLQAQSDLIDRGENRGFAFNGAAPDLGAFESGPPVAIPSEPAPGTPDPMPVPGTTPRGTDARSWAERG